MAEVHVKGLAELQRVLDQLPAKLERNVVRGGLRAGMKTVLPVAQGNIHSVSGALSNSLKVGTSARNGEVTARVYTRVFYAKFVEYGTKPHVITAKDRKGLAFGGLFFQSVDHPGAKAAAGGRGFLRAALDAQKDVAVVAAGNYMANRLATKHGLDTADIEIEVEE